MTKLTREEIVDVVEEAIRQSAELSGLTEWFVFHALNNGADNEDQLCQEVGQSLVMAFEGIPDPDDTEFWDYWEKKHENDA